VSKISRSDKTTSRIDWWSRIVQGTFSAVIARMQAILAALLSSNAP
jgi:hypothetical protein